MNSSYRDPIDLEPLPPARRVRRLLRRRARTPWLRYGLAAAVPVAVVALLAGQAVRSSHLLNGRQRQQASTAGAPSTTGDGGTGGAADGPSAPPSEAAAPSAAASTGVPAAAGGYEAERATLGPTTKLRDVPGASGGVVVTNVGHGTPAGDVTFNAVTAKAAGTYTVALYYLVSDAFAHRLALWVNGKGPTILSFAPLAAGATAKVDVLRATVTLNAGTNTVRFSNATAKYGPDLDRIVVTPQQ